jgi:uncharacterized protein (TIGR02453 family)
MDIITSETFAFLSLLKENNNRDWFTKHKLEFQTEQKKTNQFYLAIFENLKKHDSIESLKMFRIYRDVRFSKNKEPYKTHFGGHFVRASQRKRGGYYLQISPNNSFLAGGFWKPNKEDLFRIRKEFEMDAVEIRKVINEPNFKKYFENLKGDALKTAPRGFDKVHPDIDLIRMKQFIAVRNFSDAEVLSLNFLNEVDNSFKALRPFLDYMSDVLTTDLNGVSII